MTTRLSDIIDVTIFQDLPPVNSPELTAFFQSGVAVRNALLDGIANSAGKVAELPFWRDLDIASEPNYSTDDPADIAAADPVTQGEQIGRKAFLNKGWGSADLATELAMGPNAMDHIRARVDNYWTHQWQNRLIASADGILADNVANDAGDMVIDVSIADGNAATEDNLFSRDAFIDATGTMGDNRSKLAAIAVHSTVYGRMLKNDDVVFIPDSQGNLTIPTYMGLRVIQDDSMTVVAGGTSGFIYTSVIFGNGAFGYGNGMPVMPVEVERQATQGEGGGIESLWTRKTWLLHPFGFQATGTPTGNSFTLPELRLAASWDRVVDRKSVPLAFLRTNG